MAPDWTGCNDFTCQKAQQMVEMGYIGFAIDMYGEGKLGKNNEEKSALIQPMIDDRQLLIKRITAAYQQLQKQPEVIVNKIAAMGFCFGGLCVIDLARSGADVLGVVSFHGLLFPLPDTIKQNTIQAKLLILHGYEDPMVPPDSVIAFTNEMTQTQVDWQLHMYGKTMHAFTNPLANDKNFGTVYSQVAERRALQSMVNFLDELF